MKYLKRFNEEMRSTTYSSASRKLAKIGHVDRSNVLKDWSKQAEKREELDKWRDNIKNYSPFGVYKLNVINPNSDVKFVGDFALDINFDQTCFEDSFEYEKEKDPDNISGVGIVLFIGIIPVSEDVINKCEDVMPCAEFSNGMYWGMACSIDFKIQDGKFIFVGFTLENYDKSLSGNISFADRVSAQRFKTLLKSIFSDSKLGYPSGYSDVNNIYEKLKQVIIDDQGFADNYGFELKSVSDFINTISANTIYKTI